MVTWWKERADSCRLSSDLHTCSRAFANVKTNGMSEKQLKSNRIEIQSVH